MANKIKVLIVDDSALVRQVLTQIIESSSNLEVIGVARDPIDAREKIKQLNPDVLTLDVEMPKMDGVTFLKNLMRLRPMPVVMISTLTEAGADITLEALEVGAVDFIAKPKIDVQGALQEYTDEILEKIETAGRAKVREYKGPANTPKVDKKLDAGAVLAKKTGKIRFKTTDKIVAIGASTGGTEAIKAVLESLPADAPGIVISQHIPITFSKAFTERVNKTCQVTVCEPADGQKIVPGHAYIAPGDKHLLVERSGAEYICRLNDGPPVSRHKPSVDVMFRSVAQNVGPNAMGVMLTGMGADGAQGMLEMKQLGAYNISQDEDSCVVWGMPGAAVKMGAVDKEFTLSKIGNEILRYCLE
ncbi:Chemotaxis response regulator protein-glutamate methylesterase CheB [hydrothermal vent metagenome]|uniref:protein-glutamate methylesterase n=1 Tax=hydrothermal vent metagenome TaxID=652676 RepID=A0A3B0YNR4_9ZZZZ